jgi:hypothetical protein
MNRSVIRAAVCVLAAGAGTAIHASAARTLRHDPFDWSVLQRTVEAKQAQPVPPPAAEAQARRPRLRAVMRGPSGGQANLDGTIIGVGESAAGYRLVEVREFSAVFSRNGATVELEVARERPE